MDYDTSSYDEIEMLLTKNPTRDFKTNSLRSATLFFVNCFSCLINTMFYLYAQIFYYNQISTRYMPGFSKPGTLVGDNFTMKCDGVLACSHFICEYNYTYIPSDTSKCGMSQNDLLSRSGTEYIALLLHYSWVIIIIQATCFSLTALLINITPFNRAILPLSITYIIFFLGVDSAIKLLVLISILHSNYFYVDIPIFIFISEVIGRRVLYSCIGLTTLISNMINFYIIIPSERELVEKKDNIIFDIDKHHREPSDLSD